MSADPTSAETAPTPLVIAGLILAAGESSRMGADKALLMYRGRSFLESIISTLQQAGIERVVVVLGHHAAEIQQSIDLSTVEVVVNQDYRRGQTSSLQAGLRVLAEKEPDGVVIYLVDHPAIAVDTVAELIQHFESAGRPVTIPQLNGKHGHPVLVGRELLGELLVLGPDQGADSVIHKNRDRTEYVDVADPGIILDVDDPEAYLKLTTQR